MDKTISIKELKSKLGVNYASGRGQAHIEGFLSLCDAMSNGSQSWGIPPKSLENYIGKGLFDKLFGSGHAVKEGDNNG